MNNFFKITLLFLAFIFLVNTSLSAQTNKESDSLSVKKDEPGSHSHLPYHLMLNAIFRYLNTSRNRVVFLFLVNQAQAHSSIITNTNHLCLKTSHPSPLSAYRGFHESKLFSKTDDFFKKEELNIINWCLES